MLKNKTTVVNQLWSEDLRVRVGEGVRHIGRDWTSVTGKNSEPAYNNIDWQLQSPIGEPGTEGSFAPLNSLLQIPSQYLPSYVDDILEGTYIDSTTFNDLDSNPYTPETGKVYVDTTTNLTYRWSGSLYVNLSEFDAVAVIALWKEGLLAADAKTALVDADILPTLDTEDSNNVKRFTLANLKTYLITAFNSVYSTIANANKEYLMMALSNEDSDLEVATGVITFRMPYGMTLSSIRANVKTAPTGSILIVDIKQNGTTILSTLLSIDASSKTSVGASTPAVISNTSLADDAEMTVDVTQIGSTIPGTGLKITFIGTRTT